MPLDPFASKFGNCAGKTTGSRQGAVVVFPKIHRVFVEPFEHRFGDGGHARFCIAAGGGVIAVDIAKIPLPVDQRIADVEILREARHRIINRRVPMGVIVPHDVARNLGRLAEAPGRGQTQFAHRVEDTPVHRLQPVPRIRQGTVHDRAERIGQIPFAKRAAQRLGEVRGFFIRDIVLIAHRFCLAAQLAGNKHRMATPLIVRRHRHLCRVGGA